MTHTLADDARRALPSSPLHNAQGFTAINLLACAGRTSTLSQLLTVVAWLVTTTGLPDALVE